MTDRSDSGKNRPTGGFEVTPVTPKDKTVQKQQKSEIPSYEVSQTAKRTATESHEYVQSVRRKNINGATDKAKKNIPEVQVNSRTASARTAQARSTENKSVGTRSAQSRTNESKTPSVHTDRTARTAQTNERRAIQSNIEVTGNSGKSNSQNSQGRVNRERIGIAKGEKTVRRTDARNKSTHREDFERENSRRREELNALSAYFKPNDGKLRNYWINLLIVTFKMFLICLLIVGFSGVGFVLGMSKSYLETVPELDFSQVTEQDQAALLYDSNGEVIGNYYNMENREWAELSEIPENLQNAVIAIEDVRFRRHMGIDFKRIIGAAVSNLSGGSMQGGSTLTQQLIKNTMLSFEQTYKRKIQEASLALELETMYSKDQILEAYLNTIYMGGSCYGVKTAAKDYFGKELSELTLRECACLAGLIQNPSRYNPRSNYYSRSNPKRTDNRTNLVLYEMCENGFITQEQYAEAKADTMSVLEESPYASQTSMVYFTDYILDSAIDEIIEDRNLENNSKTRTQIRKEIRTGGYSIYSTLDSEKQLAAEEAVYNFNNYPQMRSSTDSYTVVGTNPDGSVIRLVQPQAAMAVVDYRNGHIIALVGGRQAPTGSLQFNRSYQSTMPVGSSIKPISVYAPAIEKGAGIGSVYYDFQMRIKGWGTEADKGYPANNSRTYNNAPVQMRRAITASLNTTAAQALMYDVGLDDSYNYLKKLGVPEDHISKTGSGLALGSSGITPLEMAGAYTAIANLGTYIEPIAFTKIVDKDGNVIVDMESKQEKRKVFSESTAWQITDMMRSVALGNSRTNVPGQTVYGKTGTNSDNKGVFFAGFTGYYVGCTWIGSDAYKSLVSSAQGGGYAAPLFAAVMTAIHKGLPNKAANDVDPASIGVVKMQYCSISGKKATAACPTTHTEYGNPASIPDCELHSTVKICSVSGGLATEYCPSDSITEKSITMVPSSGILNDMYNNNHSIFVKVAGEAVLNMSKCTVHGVSDTPAEDPA